MEFFQDRHPKSSLASSHPELFEYLVLIGAISPLNETVHYCGLIILSGDRSYMFLPRSTVEKNRIHAPETKIIAGQVMSALVRFGRESNRVALKAAEGLNGTIAPVIEELARDFRDFGIYSERLRIESKNNGKTNWKRTINSEFPFASNRGAIYLNLRTTKPVNSEDNILALVQTEIIREICERHSWWLGNSLGMRNKPQSRTIRWPRQQWAALLKKFMSGLYSDRPLRLARLLCDYLEAERSNPEGAFFCGLRDFHTVWETMLRDTLSNTENGWSSLLPTPWYILKNGRREQSAGMIPDIVIRENKFLMVVDAKYYAASSVNNAPGLSDILKQISYLNAVKSVEPGTSVQTCFVFPAAEHQYMPFQEVRFFERDGSPSPRFAGIHCRYAKVASVLDGYVKRKKVSLSDLVQEAFPSVSELV